jgi:Ca2+/Na+ antiporter
MNRGQKNGLGLNFLGLVLFVVWFIFRNSLSITASIIFAAVFLCLLVASLVVMIRATRQAQASGEKNSKQG